MLRIYTRIFLQSGMQGQGHGGLVQAWILQMQSAHCICSIPQPCIPASLGLNPETWIGSDPWQRGPSELGQGLRQAVMQARAMQTDFMVRSSHCTGW